jgi:L-threonylcarbamoyladenylate synthase
VVLVASEREVLQHIAAVDLAVFDYLDQSPKPTTVIYDNAIGFPDNILAEDGSVAIRICKDAFCKHLIKRFRKPIVSTSANFSGMPSPVSYSDIDRQIRSGVDYVVIHRQNEKNPANPSSIIKWHNGNIEIIR